MAICDAAGITVIEDCAHTMGAAWRGVPSGRHGLIGCYSTQTYKHANSGEGGFVVTDDAELAAKMVVMSGSYMLFDRHGAAPDSAVFEEVAEHMPNLSGRMDNLRAAILRPQIAMLESNVAAWNHLYRAVEDGLRDVPGLTIVERPEEEPVGPEGQRLNHDGDAALAASLFHYNELRIVDLKEYLHNEQVPVRLSGWEGLNGVN